MAQFLNRDSQVPSDNFIHYRKVFWTFSDKTFHVDRFLRVFGSLQLFALTGIRKSRDFPRLANPNSWGYSDVPRAELPSRITSPGEDWLTAAYFIGVVWASPRSISLKNFHHRSLSSSIPLHWNNLGMMDWSPIRTCKGKLGSCHDRSATVWRRIPLLHVSCCTTPWCLESGGTSIFHLAKIPSVVATSLSRGLSLQLHVIWCFQHLSAFTGMFWIAHWPGGWLAGD